MLESIKPGFLQMDVYRRAQENDHPRDFPAALTDAELLKLEASQLYVLPRSQKRILESGKGSPVKSQKRGTVGLEF